MRTASSRSVAWWFAAGLLVVALPLAGGCGNGKGDVSGKVTYKGELLKFGSVQFMSPAGAMVSEIQSDGTYSLTGVPSGTSKISVTCQDDEGYVKYMHALAASAKDKSKPKPKGHPDDFSKVPAKYNDFDKSGLTYEVKSGKQTYDIELK